MAQRLPLRENVFTILPFTYEKNYEPTYDKKLFTIINVVSKPTDFSNPHGEILICKPMY